MSRAYRNDPGESDLSRFEVHDRTPANKDHQGVCPCGVTTSRMVGMGVGWQCRDCGEKKRARTRGMKPEQRHTAEGSAMGCSSHHRKYDAGAIELAMAERGANGPMRAVYDGKVYMLFPLIRRVELS